MKIKLELWNQIRGFDRSARLFLLATVIEGTIYSGWMLFFNFYILERGFDRNYLGIVNALPSLSSLLFGIPLGMLSDRIGRKPSMLIGVGLGILCMALEVTVLDANLILFYAFLQGIGNMLYYISQAPYMMQVSDSNNRSLLFSLNFGLVTISGAIGNLFAGQLPELFGSWLEVAPRSATAYQAVLLTSVCLGMLMLIPLFLIKERQKEENSYSMRSNFLEVGKVLRKPLIWKLSFPNMLIGFGAAVLIPYMNVFFLERFSLPDKQLGILFSLSAVFTGVGSLLAPRLVNQCGGKIRAVVFTQGLSLVFLMFIGFSKWYGLVAASFLIRGTLMNMAVPLFHAFSLEQIEEEIQGTANSILELAWQVGWAVGPYLSGLIQANYGFSPLFVITGVLYAIANVVTWAFFRHIDDEV